MRRNDGMKIDGSKTMLFDDYSMIRDETASNERVSMELMF